MPPPNRLDDADRWFWPKVDRSGGPDACWPWLGSRNAYAYGKTTLGGTWMLAHRVAWLLEHGELPQRPQQVNHHCNIRHCCNPRHMYVGTQAENVHDSIRAGTHVFNPRNPKRKKE